jgi:hypothetical protein
MLGYGDSALNYSLACSPAATVLQGAGSGTSTGCRHPGQASAQSRDPLEECDDCRRFVDEKASGVKL